MMLKKNYSISVILPCYNCEKFIKDSISSILNQTFSDFELIVIDDNSTDGTLAEISRFSDKRIKVITKSENLGLVDSLNLGISSSQGKYILIMHGDDISMPERLQVQWDVMESNPNVVCAGSWIQILGTNKVIEYPTQSEDILVKMIEGNQIAHPTVIMRTSIIREHNLKYNPYFHAGAEDYEFWYQLFKYGEIINVPIVLLKYRMHDNQKTELYKPKIIELTKKIRTGFLTDLLPNTNFNNFLDNYSIVVNKDFGLAQFDEEINKLIQLKAINYRTRKYNRKKFNNYIHLKEFYLVRAFIAYNCSIYHILMITIKYPSFVLRAIIRRFRMKMKI